MFDRLTLRRSTAGQDDLRLDAYLPEFDTTVRRHVVVDAPAGVTFQAIRTANLADTGIVTGLLGSLRQIPELIDEARGGESPEPMPERMTFGGIDDAEGWVHLETDPDREFVFGAVGRFWQPVIEWRDVDAEAFSDFEEPGWGKIAASVSVRPYGAERTLLSFEARTAMTDDDARRRFGRYWLAIGPFAGYMMRQCLRRIKADAETAYAMADGDAAEAESMAADIEVA